MQASHEGRLVRIEQPELLEHIFLLTQDRSSQAALLRTNKAWAAVGQRCSPLEVAVAQAGGACWPLGKRWGNALPGSSAQPEKLGGGLPDVAAWLTRQRRLVVKMSLEFDSTRLLHWARADNAVNMGTEIVQAHAAAVLQAVAPHLHALEVHSAYDIQRLPPLPALISLSLSFYWDTSATGPLDCIATAAPQLQGLHASRPFGANQVGPAVLSPAASLPSSLTSLSLEGYSAGFEPHQSQLVSLWWQPMERYGRVRFPNEAIEGLSQASRLTSLYLTAPGPANIPAFFDSLACLTSLRSLVINSALLAEFNTTLSNRQYYLHAADHEYVLEELLPNALGQLAALTGLSLNGHDMPVCPWSLAHLLQLKHLDIRWNEGLRQLPHGPWPALEQLEVDNELIDAALADQPAQPEGCPPAGEREGSAETGAGPGEGAGHALWSLSRLTHLRGLRGMAEEEEKKQAVRRLLPQLVRLE